MDTGTGTKPADFSQVLGFRREEWREGHGSLSLLLEPHHLNGSGVVHGGVLATLLDAVTGMAGLYCTTKGNRRHSTTVSLTTHFISQAKAGKLTATGRMTSRGGKLFFSEAEVRSEDGTVIATASAVHRYRSGSEKAEGVPKRS